MERKKWREGERKEESGKQWRKEKDIYIKMTRKRDKFQKLFVWIAYVHKGKNKKELECVISFIL